MPDFDVVVVGAGPAGSAAALTAAKAGSKVLVIERGPEPGAKNVSGARIRLNSVKKVFDISSITIERKVIGEKFIFVSQGRKVTIDTQTKPDTVALVSRLKFDGSIAKQAENVGALIITKTTAIGIERQNTDTLSIITDRGPITAKSVILAEGANALLSMGLGIRPEFSQNEAVEMTKEIYLLNKDEVNKRFNLPDDYSGLTWEVIIDSPIPAAGFLYTYKDSIAIGVGTTIKAFLDAKMKPYMLLEEFKKAIGFNELVKGGSLREYSSKIIPEGGFPEWRACGDNVYLAGDAAGLVNALVLDGIGPAIVSGALAGKAAVEGYDCEKYEQELAKLPEVHSVIMSRPVISSLLSNISNLELYARLVPDVFEAWASGDLSTLRYVKGKIPDLLKLSLNLLRVIS